MRMKSYFARTVEAALTQARLELGDEAVLVNSRKSGPEARHLGEYEVVFAAGTATESSTRSLNGESPTCTPSLPDGQGLGLAVDPWARQFADLKAQLEQVRRTIAQSALATPGWLPPSSHLAEVYSSLLAAEVERELAREVVEELYAKPSGGSPSSLNHAVALGLPTAPAPEPRFKSHPLQGRNPYSLQRQLEEVIESRFAVDSSLGPSGGSTSTIAFVGPPGSGKTTSLVKLAVRYGLTSRRPMQILSADTYRVAAADQLRTYAAVLGVGFQPLETVGALAQALEEHNSKGLIFIDTPGFSTGDMESAVDWANFLCRRPEIDTHLVLMASMKPADIRRAVDRFEIFQPSRLLFTRLDETESCGPIFSQAARTGKPVSFLATGQRIPEDIEPATKGRITGLVLQGQLQQSQPAA